MSLVGGSVQTKHTSWTQPLQVRVGEDDILGRHWLISLVIADEKDREAEESQRRGLQRSEGRISCRREWFPESIPVNGSTRISLNLCRRVIDWPTWNWAQTPAVSWRVGSQATLILPLRVGVSLIKDFLWLRNRRPEERSASFSNFSNVDANCYSADRSHHHLQNGKAFRTLFAMYDINL